MEKVCRSPFRPVGTGRGSTAARAGGSIRAADATPRRGLCFEAGERDPFAAHLTRSVAAEAESPLRGFDLDQLRAGIVEERRHLRPLEPDGGTLGIVLVVEIGRLRRFDDRGQGLRQLANPGRGPGAGRVEHRVRAGVVHDARVMPIRERRTASDDGAGAAAEEQAVAQADPAHVATRGEARARSPDREEARHRGTAGREDTTVDVGV